MTLPDGSDKLVLLALADFANEAGEAWPKILTLSTKCSRGEQTVRDSLRRLERLGHISRKALEGRPSVYTIKPLAPPEIREGSENHEGSEKREGSEDRRGSEDREPTLPEIRGGPLVDIGKGPLPIFGPITINEPSTEPSGEPPIAREATKPAAEPLPDWLPKEAWRGFVDMRKRVNAPLSPRGQKLMIDKLQNLSSEGNDPERVLDQSTANSYRDIFPLKEKSHASARFPSSTAAGGTAPSPLFAAAAGLARNKRQGSGRCDDR
jgi:hypothetical protein